jgi:hypothetical protein
MGEHALAGAYSRQELGGPALFDGHRLLAGQPQCTVQPGQTNGLISPYVGA